MKNINKEFGIAVRKLINNYIVWDKQLLRRTLLGPKIVVREKRRVKILKTFDDEIGHWDVETTRQFLVDHFWWSSIGRDIYLLVCRCIDCQKSEPVPSYITAMKLPISSVFKTFSIYFAGPLPTGQNGE